MRKSCERIFLFLLAIVAFAATGCTKTPRYVLSSTFDLGTNAVVNIKQEIPASGAYEFSLKFLGVDRSQFLAEKWPLEISVDLHFVVKTNDQTMWDTNFTKLNFSHISDEQKVTVYALSGFLISKGVIMDCVVVDRSVGLKGPVQLVFFRALAK